MNTNTLSKTPAILSGKIVCSPVLVDVDADDRQTMRR